MSLFSGFTVPSSIKWSRLGRLTSNKWLVTWRIEASTLQWIAATLKCMPAFSYCAPCLDFSHLSLRCRYSMSPCRRWFSVANHGHGSFFSASRKMLANRSLRCDIHRPNWAHRVTEFFTFVTSLFRFSSKVFRFFGFCWFLFNEQVYRIGRYYPCAYAKAHLVIAYALANWCTDLYL